jgi:hypothetical protein
MGPGRARAHESIAHDRIFCHEFKIRKRRLSSDPVSSSVLFVIGPLIIPGITQFVRDASIAADAASAVLKKRPQSTDVRAEKTETHTHTHTHNPTPRRVGEG